MGEISLRMKREGEYEMEQKKKKNIFLNIEGERNDVERIRIIIIEKFREIDTCK